MRTNSVIALASLVLLVCAAAILPAHRAEESDPLRAGFQHPPREARLRCYWWWLNGHTTEATITSDLEQMQAKGYGGALLVDANGSEQGGNLAVPAGPMFGTPRWRELYRHALKEASRLGLEVSLNILSGWNLGGPTVKPDQGAKVLTWSQVVVHGPSEFHEQLAQPAARLGFYRDIAVLAYPVHHGPDLPKRAIRQLAVKSAAIEFGMSTPPTAPLLEDIPAEIGEQDAALNEVQDLTAVFALAAQPASHPSWRVPAGDWEILRIGYTASGAKVSTSSGDWQGLALDHLDHTALDAYWHEVMSPLLDDARPYIPRTLRYLVTDSLELGGLNWTGRFRQEFQQRRGYDLLPYLPIIAGRIVEDRAASNRFLNDFRRTVGDLMIREHYAHFADLAAQSGLQIHPESGGPHGVPIDALETLGTGAFPQTEFWAVSTTHRVRDDERFFVKEASSAAHIYGKTIVAAEGMTSIGPQWEESIGNDLKPTFDQAVCEGLNRMFWHAFTSSPKEMGVPGQEYFAGTHLNPNVTWWNQAGPFIAYMNRTQFLMQQGRPVSDVLYYYGDQVPNFVQLKNADPAQILPGYDYDVTDENVLVHRLHVRDGRIALPEGVTYAILVLPNRPAISLEALRAVRKLVADGATVLGPRPQRATGLSAQGDSEVRAIASELWGDGECRAKEYHYGKGVVYCGQSTRAVLAARAVEPDFVGLGLDYVHRQADDADIYFVRNTQSRRVNVEAVFRLHGRTPELWQPATGDIQPAWIYDLTTDGRTRIPLWLEPYESIFVVFRQAASRRIMEVSKDGSRLFPSLAAMLVPELKVRMGPNGLDLETSEAGHYILRTDGEEMLAADVPASREQSVEGPWNVAFEAGWGAPATVTFEKLLSWPDSSDPGIRYYSGRARYSKRIDISPADLKDRHLYLDLGEVREIAETRWNGRDMGILWKAPFVVDLGETARSGRNDLEVAVTNLWPNRLIGDQRLPVEQRRTHTNITKFHADSPLMPSGLLGPVRLRFEGVGRTGRR
jgi:hypothetical protein